MFVNILTVVIIFTHSWTFSYLGVLRHTSQYIEFDVSDHYTLFSWSLCVLNAYRINLQGPLTGIEFLSKSQIGKMLLIVKYDL